MRGISTEWSHAPRGSCICRLQQRCPRTCSPPGIFVWALYSSHDPLVVRNLTGRFGDLLRSPREAWGLSFSHQANNPTVSQCLGPGDGKDQGTLPQLFAQYVMCSENTYESRTCKSRRAAGSGSTLPALAKPRVNSNTEVSSPPLWLFGPQLTSLFQDPGHSL